MSQQQMQEGLAAAQKLLLASRAQHSAEMAALKQQLAAAQQSSQQSAQQGATATAELDQAKKVSTFQGVAHMGLPVCLLGCSQVCSLSWPASQISLQFLLHPDACCR